MINRPELARADPASPSETAHELAARVPTQIEQILFEVEPRQAVPAIIRSHSLNPREPPYLPNNRAHVSVSLGFPQGIGFLGNPTAVRPAVGTCSTRESTHGVTSFLSLVLCRT